MDEISTGLDSSTTYQIVRCIRNMVHLREVRSPLALLFSVHTLSFFVLSFALARHGQACRFSHLLFWTLQRDIVGCDMKKRRSSA
jgi:hypothetical protein